MAKLDIFTGFGHPTPFSFEMFKSSFQIIYIPWPRLEIAGWKGKITLSLSAFPP